jgi:CheY-like chemotaxis protein
MARKSSSRPVLLIDDSHEDLFLTKRLLARAGVKQPIVTVDGGEEAIVFLRAATLPRAEDLVPCAIFCDVKMPKQNGFDVLKWVRSQKALKDVPFTILTGGDVPIDRERAKELGADHFLVKFPPPEILKKIIDG